MVVNIKKKSSSTIPFGYKVLKDSKILFPIDSQLIALKNIKIKLFKGTISLRVASDDLEIKTGRSISAAGLLKMMNKEYPKWQIEANIKKTKIKKEKKRLIELEKSKLKKEKELEKQKKRLEKRVVYKECKICSETKNEDQFQKDKIRCCKNCFLLILMNSPKIYLNCRICNEKKSLSALIGLDGLKSYKYRICKPCDRERNKNWINNNKQRHKEITRKYIDKNIEKIREQRRKYAIDNKEKLKKYREVNKEKIKLQRLEWKQKNMDKYLKAKRKGNLRRNELKSNKRSLL